MSRTSIITALTLLAGSALALTGCSENFTEPVLNDTNVAPMDNDVPAIPRPTGSRSDADMESDALTVIEPLTTTFQPDATRMYGGWNLRSRLKTFGCTTQWKSNYFVEAWSDALPQTRMDHDGFACGFPQSFNETVDTKLGAWRPLIMQDGVRVDANPTIRTKSIRAGGIFLNGDYELEYTIVAPVEKPVFIRRDRVWKRALIADDTSLLIEGDISQTVTTTNRKGISRTESESFGRSLTAGGSLGWGPLSASIEGTVSETFETSVTTSEETEVSKSITVNGASGKSTVFMFWELVETYTICDENGDPYTDPNYEFPVMTMTHRGQRTALIATEF